MAVTTLGQLRVEFTGDLYKYNQAANSFAASQKALEKNVADFSSKSKAFDAHAKAAKDATAPVQNLSKTVQAHTSHVTSMGNAYAQATPKIHSATNAFSRMGVTVGNTASGLGSALRSTTTHLTSFTGGLLRAIPRTLTFAKNMSELIVYSKEAASTIGNWALGLFGANASLEQTKIGFEKLFGSAQKAQKFINELWDFAKKTPFEFGDLTNASYMLMGVGVEAKKVIPWLTAIGDAVGGVGGNAENIRSVTDALTTMITRGRVGAMEMDSLTYNRIPGWNLLAKAMHKTPEEIRMMSEQGKLLATEVVPLLVDQMEKTWGGQMQAQAGTFNGLLSTFKDTWGDIMQILMAPAFGWAKKGLEELGTVIANPAFRNFAENIGKKIGEDIKNIVDSVKPVVTGIQLFSDNTAKGDVALRKFSPALGFVRDIFSQVSTILRDIFTPAFVIASGWIEQTKKTIQGALPQMGNLEDTLRGVSNWLSGINTGPLSDMVALFTNQAFMVASGYVDSFQKNLEAAGTIINTSVLPALQEMWPTFEGLGKAIIPLLPVFQNLWDAAKKIGDVVRNTIVVAFQVFMPIIAELVNWIGSILIPIIQMLTPAFIWASEQVKKFADDLNVRLGPAIRAIAAWVKQTLDFVLSVWKAVWPSLLPVVQAAWDIIYGIIKIAWALISGIINIGLDIIAGNWGRVWQDIQDMFKGVWDGILTIANGVTNTMIAIVSGFLNFLQLAWDSMVKYASDMWNNLWKSITDYLGQIKTQIVVTITSTWNWLTDAWNNIKRIASMSWADIWKSITDYVNNIWNTITKKFTDVKNWLLGIWNDIKRGATDAWNGITGAIKGALNSLIDVLNGAITQVRNFANNIIKGVNWVADKLGVKPSPLIQEVKIVGVSHLAKGTSFFGGGLAMVGEQGPELVTLPRGSQVASARETKGIVENGITPHKIPGFAGGIGDALSTIFSWFTDGIKSVASNIISQFGVNLKLPGALGNIGNALFDKAKGWIGDKINSLFGGLFTGNVPQKIVGDFLLPPGGGFHSPVWYNASGLHQGMDFAFPQGSLMREVIGGLVWAGTGWKPWGGEIDVKLPGGLTERYLHMSQIFVSPGQFVRRGEPIGLTGGGTPASGLGYWSTGAHLHYQIDPGNYGMGINPLAVWSMFNLHSPFMFGRGGVINEPVYGFGARSGRGYLLGENGPETVTPVGSNKPIVINIVIDGKRFTREVVLPALADEATIQLGGL